MSKVFIGDAVSKENQIPKKVAEIRNSEIKSNRKSIYSAKELLHLGIQEVPKLWNPFFPTTGVVGLTGSSDCGKSMFLRQMAIAISLGEKYFLGFPLTIKYASALYVCTEDDFEGIAALLSRQAGSLDPERLANLHFIFESRDLLKQIDDFLSSTQVDFVVLDVWSDTFVGNPNNWVDVRQNLSVVKELACKYDCLIAILHHTVKNSEKHAPDKAKLNGSQAIEAKLRCLLELRNGEVDTERILYVLKANYMSRQQKSDGLLLELEPESLQFSNSGRTVSKAGFISESNKRKYDIDFWVTQMKKVREEGKLSYSKCLKLLSDEFGETNVPSKSWFMEQFKETDSRTETKDID